MTAIEPVTALSKPRRQLFCLLGAARTQPCYELFAEAFELSTFDYSKVLHQAFELYLSGDDKAPLILKAHIESNIHDSDEFSDLLADQAQHAILSLYYAVDYLLSDEPSSAEFCIENVNEAAALYDYEKGHDSDALCSEQHWQTGLCEHLSKMSPKDNLALAELFEQNRQHNMPVVD